MEAANRGVFPMVTISPHQLLSIEEELKALKKGDAIELTFEPDWICIKEEIDVSDYEDDTYIQQSIVKPVANAEKISKPPALTKKTIRTKQPSQVSSGPPGPPPPLTQAPSPPSLTAIGEKNWYHHCPTCDITYKSGVGNLCSICGHSMIYQCKKCDKTYKKYLSCYMHIRRKCYPTDFFNCNDCSYTTYLKSSLRHHIQIHLDKGQECPRCKKKLKNSFSLRGHLEYCGRKSDLECDYCKIKTLYKKSLKRHILRHHSDERTSKKKYRGMPLVNGDFDMY